MDEDLGWIGRVHRCTNTALGYGLTPQEAAVVRGKVLGDCSLIPEDFEEAFQRSGIIQITPQDKWTLTNLRAATFLTARSLLPAST